MNRDPNLTLVPPLPDEEAWTPEAEKQHDLGLINADRARDSSGITLTEKATSENGVLPGHVESVGRKATEQTAGLELVTDEHVPHRDAPREAKLKPPRKPRNWRERMAADQGRRQELAPRPEHQPILRPTKQ